MTKRRLRALKALLVFVSSLFVVGQSTADDTGLLAAKNFSGTATLTSDYVFRGLSQTREDPAVQASFDYKHPAGLFLGAWASNVDETISEGNIEIDLYGGYRGQLFKNLSYELSIIYYWYPGGGHDPDWDYVELHGGLNYAFANLPLEPNIGVGFNYSPDFYGEDGNGYYYSGQVSASPSHTVLVLGLNSVIKMWRATRRRDREPAWGLTVRTASTTCFGRLAFPRRSWVSTWT